MAYRGAAPHLADTSALEQRKHSRLAAAVIKDLRDGMRRALEVQRLLTDRGHHRLAIADLIIAATAELNGAVVLHYDKDYDTIAAVTGQPTRWIVPRGTGL